MSPLLLWLVRLLVPSAQREAFVGDLLEEARRFVEPRAGRRAAARWLWRQVLGSVPALLVARARRRGVRHTPALAGASASLSGDEVRRAFAGFAEAHARRTRRRLPLLLSAAAHGGLVAVGIVSAFWQVDELEPPPLVVVAPRPLPRAAEPPAAGAPRGGGDASRAALVPRGPRRARDEHRPAVAPAPAPASPPADQPPEAPSGPPGVADGTIAQGTGPGDASGTGGPGGDPGGAGHGTARGLPPEVGQRRCVSCPPPRLPPAYVRLGALYRALVRVCVDTNGRVSSVKVLQGIDPAVDAEIVQVVASWRLAPLTLGDHAVPFCYNARFEFTAR